MRYIHIKYHMNILYIIYTLYIYLAKYKLNIQNKLHSFVPTKKVIQSYKNITKYKISSIMKVVSGLCKEIFNGKYNMNKWPRKGDINERYSSVNLS